jgi:hypothetical protein
MAAIISDNEIDHELAKMKVFAESLKKTISIFSNNHKNLPPRERALTIQKIHNDQKTLAAFVDKAKSTETFNAGTKYGIENLKQTYLSIVTLWKKTEKILESAGAGGGRNPLSSNVNLAISNYTKALESLGKTVDKKSLDEFKSKLSSAVDQAQNKLGKTPQIDVSIQDGKIKVKLS